MKGKWMFFIIVLLYGGLSLKADNYTFSGFLPKIEKTGSDLVIKINSLKTEKEFFIYYRTAGLKTYQVRKMKVDQDGNVYYRLPTENLYGSNLEYFIVENGAAAKSLSPVFTVTNFTDKESPEIYFLDAGQVPEGGGHVKVGFPIKFGASLSSTTRIHDDSEFPGEKSDATGNIRLYRNIAEEKYEFDFDTNVSYMAHPTETESHLNLSDMKVRFKAGHHTFAVGDLSINNTEFTTSYLNRRGLRYEMEGKTLYFSTFFTNAQEKTGFDGLGIPPTDANIFAATAGVNIGTVFKLRGMFMTGKDNLDSKTVVSAEDTYREGNIYSLWGELNLLNSHLQLKGEYTHSNFGSGADSASVVKEGDNAWRAEADFSQGIFSGHVDYKKIGSRFSSIANLFLQNDREGLAGNVTMTIKSFSLNLRYQDQKTNVDSEVLPMLDTKNTAADFSWLVANHIQLGAEFSLDNLDYDKSSGLMTGSEDMNTLRYAGTLGYVSGSNSIMVKLGKTESKTFTSNIDGSLALNLRFGNVLSLNPTLSYQSTDNFSDDSTSKIYNAYLSGELTFIPEYFSLSISSSWTKNDNTFGDTTTLSLGGNLNFYMSKIFKNKIQPTLSLRGKYDDYKTGGTSTHNVTVYLQGDLSF
jgi:hypothetical protein